MVNISLIGLVILFIMIALYFFFKKNAKDKKSLVEKLNEENITIDHHNPEKE